MACTTGHFDPLWQGIGGRQLGRRAAGGRQGDTEKERPDNARDDTSGWPDWCAASRHQLQLIQLMLLGETS
jgi:hypothetical protein